MKKFVEEFKAFAIQGNVVDMAVGIIIGAAFKAIVDSLVADIINPIIGGLLGQPDFSALVLQVGNAQVRYGAFISQIVNFLIIALTLFVALKAFMRSKTIREENQA